jgi:hypothetical protein
MISEDITWSTLQSGKFEGQTLPQAVLQGPDWFLSAMGDGEFDGPLAEEAQHIRFRASHIKIPQPDPENWRINWSINSSSRFVFEIIKAEDANSGLPFGTVASYLDLLWPPLPFEYDEHACEGMYWIFRDWYFGEPGLIKETCGAFFSNKSNFVWN